MDSVQGSGSSETVAARKGAAPQDEHMAEMIRLGTPGPQHAALRPLEGRWKTRAKMWNPSGEVSETEGTSVCRLVLGGRFLEERINMNLGGMPYEGWGLTGFDNREKRYVINWVDNMSTGITTGAGSMDKSGKTLTTMSKMAGPDDRIGESRMVTKIVDTNTHVFSMYHTANGKERLGMEITYTRE